MNSDEIRKVLEIIKEPITVNCIEYKYFDQENYDKLLEVYENCLWFANNFEQINLTVENLKNENQQLKDIINKAKEYCNHGIKEYITDDGFVEEVLRDVKKILDNKGE